LTSIVIRIWLPISIQVSSRGHRSFPNWFLGCVFVSAISANACQCCCITKRWPLLLELGWYPATMQRVWLFHPLYIVQQNLPRLPWSCLQLDTLCVLLLRLSIATLPGWYRLALGSLVLCTVLRWQASHYPLVLSGSCCMAGIWCHAMLFSVVTRTSIWWLAQHNWMFFVWCPLRPPSKVLQGDSEGVWWFWWLEGVSEWVVKRVGYYWCNITCVSVCYCYVI